MCSIFMFSICARFPNQRKAMNCAGLAICAAGCIGASFATKVIYPGLFQAFVVYMQTGCSFLIFSAGASHVHSGNYVRNRHHIALCADLLHAE